jgi:polyisoprenoid-binding protein YceI
MEELTMTTSTQNPATTASTWTLDPMHVEVGFAIRHLMISTVRGRFGSASGVVVFDPANPANNKVDVTIDVASIDTRQEMRDNHLRSADFFDVANHPTMHFVGKRVEGDVTKKFRVVGDLTIRDVTREVTLDVTNEGSTKDPWGNERAGFSATAKLNRSDFNLNWNQALEAGGVVVGEEVKLSIDAELIRQVSAPASAAA